MSSVIRGSDNFDSAQAVPVLMTAVTASGTSVDFTGIPSWAKRITVMFSGVSTNGTSGIELTIGDSGGVETTGYVGSISRIGAAAVATANHPSDAFTIVNDLLAADITHGVIFLNLVNQSLWVMSSSITESGSTASFFGSGSKSLSETLTSIRVQTTNGTDTFDAGTINVMYE